VTCASTVVLRDARFETTLEHVVIFNTNRDQSRFRRKKRCDWSFSLFLLDFIYNYTVRPTLKMYVRFSTGNRYSVVRLVITRASSTYPCLIRTKNTCREKELNGKNGCFSTAKTLRTSRYVCNIF